MSFKKDAVVWIIIISFVLVIFGIYLSRFTPLDLQDKSDQYAPSPLFSFNANKIAEKINENIQENFSNSNLPVNHHIKKSEHFKDESTSNQIESGASEYYNWGLKDKEKTNISIDMPSGGDYSTLDYDWKSPEWSQNNYHGKKYNKSNKKDKCDDKKEKSEREICYECDITANKDIDKYVLKSSIPPCPDMANYATKTMLKPDMNPNEWVKKNEIQPCPKVDLRQYVLKSEIPACPPQVTCPVCPICPKCPEIPKCKTVNEFNITEHPDMKDYIKKSDVLNSDIVKKHIADNYVEKSKCLTLQNKTSSNTTSQSQSQSQSQSTSKQQNIIKPQSIITSEVEDENSKYKMGNVQGLYAGDSLYATV